MCEEVSLKGKTTLNLYFLS